MTSITATVETLTAEVRVLMVGSRQVTLSVYRQLDQVEPESITPFGRVNTGRLTDDPKLIELVGVNESGNLVRAVSGPAHWVQYASPDFEHWNAHIAQQGTRYANPCTVWREDDLELRWRHGEGVRCDAARNLHPEVDYCHHPDDKVQQWLCAEHRHRRAVGELCNLPALQKIWWSEAETEFADLYVRHHRYKRHKELPLIVLAGLR